MAQREDILKYLKEGNGITPITALKLFGCFRLGARIWEIREDLKLWKRNLEIETKFVDVGDGKTVAEYRLVKKGQLSLFEGS